MINWICWKLKWGWVPVDACQYPHGMIKVIYVNRKTGKWRHEWRRRNDE